MNAYLTDMKLLAPELVLTALAVAVLVWDMIKKGRDSRQIGWLTLGGLAVTAWLLLHQWSDLGEGGARADTVFGMVTIDRYGTFFKLFTVGALAVVTFLVTADRRERKHGVGEYYFLLIGAAIGIFFMVSTNNVLLLMLGLELLSLASYALAGFHKSERRSGEAALKYVVFGGLSAGVMLYGISLLYGMSGTLDLVEMGRGVSAGYTTGIAAQFGPHAGAVPLAVAFVLILAGFAYKVSAVPFHFWTPDVYEGAPTPVTTFLAVASKAAGFAVLLRFVGALFLGSGVDTAIAAYGKENIGLLIAVIAALTMTLGNLSALRQASLKRMLAYSSIAHAGYVLMGLAAMTVGGYSAAIFYLAAYYFMNLGAFGFLLYFEGVTGSERIDSLRGLGWKHPLVSWTMVVFLISLTGLPPTVGFLGKFLLFRETLVAGLGWLVVIAALNSVVSLFYYFRVAKALFLSPAEEGEVTGRQPALGGVLVALGVCTVLFGLFGGPLQGWTKAAPASLGIPSEVEQD